ncbi:MAG: AMP-binding protein, partial [Myxococcota bacterium]
MTDAPSSSQWGRLRDPAHEQELRQQAEQQPGSFHGAIAAAELHWFEADTWWSREPESNTWRGYGHTDGAPADVGLKQADWRPWRQPFDDAAAPFYRWFVGAKTNACFNEVDRHVLAGRGAHPAFIFEGDRWDPSKHDGKGGPVVEQTITYRDLLLQTVIRAEVLHSLGLKKGDRVAFNLPNIPDQLFYTEAAKRLGIIYTPVFGGFSAKTLSDRIYDAGARIVVTADGGYRNAEVIPYKERFTDLALDNFIPRPTALAALTSVLSGFDLDAAVVGRLFGAVEEALAGEITIERSDLMRELGAALGRESTLSPERTAELRTTVARELAAAQHAVETVVVVKYTGQDIVVQSRDRWSHDLVATAEAAVLDRAKAAGASVNTLAELASLDDHAFWRALTASHPAVPVEADWPCFIIYTSGSTGKPKGVVH